MLKKVVVFNLLVFVLFLSLIGAQTSPEDFLGHKVGADRKLADYNQIYKYFKTLDKESNQLKLVPIGTSTLKKEMFMAVITAEKNMAKLETYRNISKRLRNARGLTEEDAEKLAAEGKIIVFITCSLHSTEIAASQMSMEFAYNLVTGKTPFNAEKVLDDVIVLLAPTINPDGHQIVTEWYRENLGTVYEGCRMPWLYHHYAGHDNNRDWYMFNLAETRAVSKVLYHDWVPQIHMDEHQMGSTRARLFLPPFSDPPVPTVHPLVWRGIALCGTSMAFDLQKEGYKGVVYDRSFTGWWIGACDDTSWLHNSIGLLSEMASVKGATPIYIDPTEIPKSYTESRIKFPDPWPGGWWHLRNLVDYELTFSMSLIKTAYLHKQDFLMNFYKMCKDSCEKRAEGQPFAFVIPKKQHDSLTTLKMLEVLKFGGVEIHRAAEDFIAEGKAYPAGSYVVLMSQPYRPYAQALLEKQEYPDLRKRPGDPPIPPYDNAGWTLPLQMGVTCHRVDTPFKAALTDVQNITYPTVTPPADTAPYIVLDAAKNVSYPVVLALLKKNAEVFRSTDTIKGKDFKLCAGSFIIKNTPGVRETIAPLLKKHHLESFELNDVSTIAKAPLKKHRIGVYQSWQSNMDEGWTRYVLDDLGIPFTVLHNKDFKDSKKKKADLLKRFDVIVFADDSPELIKTGNPDPKSRWARYYTPMPKKYMGGIEKEGVEALKDFAARGGILIMLNDAGRLILKEFKAPAENILEKVNASKFFCPSSLLKVKVNNKTPMGYGMPKDAAVLFSYSPVFKTWIPTGEWDRTVVASYPKENPLMSGWLLGGEMITRKPALVDFKYKKGHIVLIGFRCQHRAQSHGTYKFLLNGLLYPEG
ncbi:MAG: hypothetical protein GY765_42435 [bacterium]|nr:hypothetical protein [bacterium]